MEKVNEIFINSMDDPLKFTEISFISTENVKSFIIFNNIKWDDGAPVIKYFYRKPMYIDYTYLKGQEYKFLLDNSDNLLYYYDKNLNGWILDENLYDNYINN